MLNGQVSFNLTYLFVLGVLQSPFNNLQLVIGQILYLEFLKKYSASVISTFVGFGFHFKPNLSK